MPRIHRCGAHDCRTLIPVGERYCKAHKPERNPDSDRWYNHKRKYENSRQEQLKFYHSRAWQHVRSNVMDRDHGVCGYCLLNGIVTVATLVDHIMPREIARDIELDEDNLIACCSGCHAVKTQWEQRHYGTGKGNTIKPNAVKIGEAEMLKPIFEKGGGLG